MILMPKWTRRCIQQRIMLIIIVNKCQLRVRFGAKRVQNPYALCMSLLSFHCALHPCWLGSRSTRPARSKWKKEDLLVCIANMTDHFLSEKKLWFGASKCCDLRQRRRRKKSWSERKRQGWLAFFGDLFPISLKNQEKKEMTLFRKPHSQAFGTNKIRGGGGVEMPCACPLTVVQ